MLQVPEQEFNEKPHEPWKLNLVLLYFLFWKTESKKLQRMYKEFFFSHIKGRFIFVAFFFYLEMINMDLSSRVEDGNNATPIHLSDIYYWKGEKSRAGFIVFDIGMIFSVCMMIKLVKGRISS